jgi:hypothetical protein
MLRYEYMCVHSVMIYLHHAHHAGSGMVIPDQNSSETLKLGKPEGISEAVESELAQAFHWQLCVQLAAVGPTSCAGGSHYAEPQCQAWR